MTDTICIICLTSNSTKNDCCQEHQIQLAEFLQFVDWEKLKAEKVHLDQSCYTVPEFAIYCKEKSARIQGLLDNYVPARIDKN